MRPTRTGVLLTAGLVTALGIPAVSAAAAPADLFVNNGTDSHCSDTLPGAGSQTTPFCTVLSAAKAAQAGQTVRITPGDYGGDVTVARSGEPGKPITFTADPWTTGGTSQAVLMDQLTVDGASHVVLRGFSPSRAKIERSDDTVIEGAWLRGPLVIGAGSTDVRVSQSTLMATRIEAGAQRTVLNRNIVRNNRDSVPVISVVDAPGSVLANNTVVSFCEAGISVGGGSTGSSVFNNAISSDANQSFCATPNAPRHPLVVAQSAVAGTRAGSNVLRVVPVGASAPYRWSGTDYATPSEFQKATGQGAHDILNPAEFNASLIDSADATAPGALASPDMKGFGPIDNPLVANTGKDGSFLDRGATETHDRLSSVSMTVLDPWAPVGTTVQVESRATTDWPSGMSYSVDFGDGSTPVITTPKGGSLGAVASHVYSSPCACVIKVTASNGAGKKVFTERQVKVTAAGPLTAAFTATPVLPVSDSPTERVSPLTVQIDPSATKAPWRVIRTDVDFGDGTTEFVSDLSKLTHTYRSPGTYTVTLTTMDSKGATSGSKRTVKADYAPSGYVPVGPYRILDSRGDTPTQPSGTPIALQVPRGLDRPEFPISGGVSAVVLNVTVTDALEDTHLTVWPGDQPRPATSNVSVRAGATTSNTVTVPVGGGLDTVLAQLNSGAASIIVDMVGYYQPNIGQRFSPLAPTRVLDTRTTGGALSAAKTRTVKVAGVNGIPADAKAVALNLTATGAKEQAHVIAYPDPAKRPATSNLNVEPGKDKSNQAIVPVGPNGTITLYTNTGSTHVILDAVGYYGKDGKSLFTPAVPKRLADTRTTGKVAPGATTTVSGIPAGAVGAVLNVTATDTTGPGFLTAYAFGATRPGASSLNTLPGITVPNHVTTPVANGKVSIFNSQGGSNHVITDLLGYFTQP
ncbi:PKD domain-containing protein [Streptomyces sp. NBC_00347]|uniref:PKD domain-containing protein n=1 Tax=Streptomyces sp. NBC_00347 TaxID=2975721 RepID=UPI00225BF38C|nr:PKD domain-containing protein [Streptomyces sp. NBC_00347]MCX5123245.1 PKD domain-containing protein [Streptomyces sp. NBC_00347]